ncbi:MAG: 3-phosphoshikimate 1-carboxyvinyltransferase [Chloroflexota bacterium]
MVTYPPTLEIAPLTRRPDARVAIPGSKSLTNRALLIAALAGGTTRLRNALFSDDSHYFAACLRTLGFAVDEDEAGATIAVDGLGGQIPAARGALFVGNAGTAARFLTAFVGLGHGTYTIDGVARMRQRPIGDLLEALRDLGVDAQALRGNGCPPVRVHGRGIAGGHVRLAAGTSSQFLTALLLAAPVMARGLRVETVGEPIAQPYIDMTVAVMERRGVHVERAGYRHFSVAPGQRYGTGDYLVEPDASGASYFFAAAAVTGGRVHVPGLGTDSLQGDTRFVDVLEAMGCRVTRAGDGLTVEGPTRLKGIEVDMNAISDTSLTLAAIAPFAAGPVTIRNVAHIRHQECDRIAAVTANLRRLGVEVEEFFDGWRIHPSQPHGAALDTYDDHRVAMAFAVTGLRTPGVVLREPRCVAKTFPDFFQRLAALQPAVSPLDRHDEDGA